MCQAVKLNQITSQITWNKLKKTWECKTLEPCREWLQTRMIPEEKNPGIYFPTLRLGNCGFPSDPRIQPKCWGWCDASKGRPWFIYNYSFYDPYLRLLEDWRLIDLVENYTKNPIEVKASWVKLSSNWTHLNGGSPDLFHFLSKVCDEGAIVPIGSMHGNYNYIITYI